MTYPIKYQNVPHQSLNKLQPNSKLAIVLLVDDLTAKQNRATIKLAHQITADVLTLPMQDVPINPIDNTLKTPTAKQLAQIDSFLTAHADQEIIATCNAGVSRSGFVSFYLDVKNCKHQGYYIDLDSFDNLIISNQHYVVANALLHHLFNSHLLSDADYFYLFNHAKKNTDTITDLNF